MQKREEKEGPNRSLVKRSRDAAKIGESKREKKQREAGNYS